MPPLPAPLSGIVQGGAIVQGLQPVCVSSDNGKATYRASLNAQTFYSTAAAVLVELQGSATKTVRVNKIGIWIQAGTKFYTELQVLRSTTLSASGTPNPVSAYPLDINDVAATAVCNNYTAAATFGTGHLVLDEVVVNTVVPSATIIAQPMVFISYPEKAFVLRGTTDVLQVYNTITGFGAGTYGFVVEWEEDNS